MLFEHFFVTSLEIKAVGGLGGSAAGSKASARKMAAMSGVTPLRRHTDAEERLSCRANRCTLALCRVGDVLGTEAVFRGLPPGRGARRGRGARCPLPGAGQRDLPEEIMERPLGLKGLLVYMPIFAKSFFWN